MVGQLFKAIFIFACYSLSVDIQLSIGFHWHCVCVKTVWLTLAVLVL